MVKRFQPVQNYVTLRLGTTTTELGPVLKKRASTMSFLYFAGHGEGGVFAGANRAGAFQGLSVSALANKLGASWPSLIYLDFCESGTFAKELKDAGGERSSRTCFVAWETPVLDGAAFTLCKGFLEHFFRRGVGNIRQAFDECDTIGEQAFEEGKRAMMEEYLIGDPPDDEVTSNGEVTSGDRVNGGVPVWIPAGATAI